MREFGEIDKIISSNSHKTGMINLINHGFLLYAETLDEMKDMVSNLELIERHVGFETIDSKYQSC